MNAINHFRQRLAQGETCIGASVSFSDPRVTDALADSVDFLWIDLEHSFVSPETLSAHLLAAYRKWRSAVCNGCKSAAILAT